MKHSQIDILKGEEIVRHIKSFRWIGHIERIERESKPKIKGEII